MPLNAPFDPYGENTGTPGNYGSDTTGSTNPAVLVDKMIGTAYDVVKHVCRYLAEVRHVSGNMEWVFKVANNLDQLGTLRRRINMTAPATLDATRVRTLSANNGVPDTSKIVSVSGTIKVDGATTDYFPSGSQGFDVYIVGDQLIVSLSDTASSDFINAAVTVFIEIENE